MLTNPVLWTQRRSLNHLSQCHLGERLDLHNFGIWVPTPNFEMTDVHQRSKMDWYFLFIVLPEQSRFCSWLWSFAMLAISRAFAIRCPRRLWHMEFSMLGARERTCAQYCIDLMNWHLSCNAIFMIFEQSSFQTPSRRFVSFHDVCVCECRILCRRIPCTGGSGPYKAWLNPWAIQTFSARFFMVSLNSMSSGSIK